jgi:DNA-binding NarL/FixJ family response regulator
VNDEQRELVEQLRPARRVLLVDDHPSFRRCARVLLAAEGFEVVAEAADGTSALALSREISPELVLLDVQLPDIDGFEVAHRLLAEDPDVAIVLVSGRDRTEYGRSIEESGARGFVAKAELSGAILESLLE